MLRDTGDLSLEAADDANIPVNCFMNEPDESCPLWLWTADNFMPRKGYCSEPGYHLEADTKEEIMEVLRAKVIPLYQIALDNMTTTGQNYYWKKPE